MMVAAMKSVFDPVFREQLVESVGEIAVSEMERAMRALCTEGDA